VSPFFRFESDRPLGLIEADDGAAGKGGRGFADTDGPADHTDQINGHDSDLEWLHRDTSLVMAVGA
jgi:hypothetical protein